MATKKGSGTLVEDTVSETSPQILLHPLVLVTLNDHATRSNVRKIGPIIGAVLGAHHGKEITMEFAFECGVDKMMEKNGELTIDGEWFTESLALCTYWMNISINLPCETNKGRWRNISHTQSCWLVLGWHLAYSWTCSITDAVQVRV